MSSYIRDYINPGTKKPQKCFCLDDFFGQHRYGYLFPKDGSDANFDDFNKDLKNTCDIYHWEDIEKSITTIEDLLTMFDSRFYELYGSFEPCDGWNPSVKKDVMEWLKKYIKIYEDNNRTNKR